MTSLQNASFYEEVHQHESSSRGLWIQLIPRRGALPNLQAALSPVFVATTHDFAKRVCHHVTMPTYVLREIYNCSDGALLRNTSRNSNVLGLYIHVRENILVISQGKVWTYLTRRNALEVHSDGTHTDKRHQEILSIVNRDVLRVGIWLEWNRTHYLGLGVPWYYGTDHMSYNLRHSSTPYGI